MRAAGKAARNKEKKNELGVLGKAPGTPAKWSTVEPSSDFGDSNTPVTTHQVDGRAAITPRVSTPVQKFSHPSLVST